MQMELVQVTTRDGVRLDGMYQPRIASVPAPPPADAVCLVHGTGGNFYGSTLFDALGEHLLSRGCAVLRTNTRGHDLMSTASTARGGRRLGAAYEIVDDCRHDLVAWVDWLKQRAGPSVGLIGHSLGAVKCLYALAHESLLDPRWTVAISPPRLSYAWFCGSPEGAEFLDAYHRAEQLVDAGQAAALMEVRLPLPFVVTAAGYVEKYGPDERYNYLRFVKAVRCPVLATFGGIEVESNMAFRGAPEELTRLAGRRDNLSVVVVPEADHFYSGVRSELAEQVEAWLHRARA